jgi:hypothetical protein
MQITPKRKIRASVIASTTGGNTNIVSLGDTVIDPGMKEN